MPFDFIKNTLHYRREINDWQRLHDAVAPRVGDPAPDFELYDVTAQHRFKLSDLKGTRPVALIFGSFT